MVRPAAYELYEMAMQKIGDRARKERPEAEQHGYALWSYAFQRVFQHPADLTRITLGKGDPSKDQPQKTVLRFDDERERLELNHINVLPITPLKQPSVYDPTPASLEHTRIAQDPEGREWQVETTFNWTRFWFPAVGLIVIANPRFDTAKLYSVTERYIPLHDGTAGFTNTIVLPHRRLAVLQDVLAHVGPQQSTQR